MKPVTDPTLQAVGLACVMVVPPGLLGSVVVIVGERNVTFTSTQTKSARRPEAVRGMEDSPHTANPLSCTCGDAGGGCRTRIWMSAAWTLPGVPTARSG